MADVTIEIAANATNWRATNRPLVMVTADIGYLFFIDSSADLRYKKTTDGGATFAASVIIRTGTVDCFEVWYDKWTPGDTGTLIHIAYQDSAVDDILYRTLDTAAGDVLNPTVASSATGTIVKNGVSFTGIIGLWDARCISITKAIGGNLYISSNPDSYLEDDFYRSIDNGATWTEPLISGVMNISTIFLQFPANTSDPQDICLISWKLDTTVAPGYVIVYDNSVPTTGNTPLTGIPAIGPNTSTYFQMSGSVRHSDKHIILAYWSGFNAAASRLVVLDINPANTGLGGSIIVQKTDVITNLANYAQCAVFIDQNNDDIYVLYLGGSVFGTDAHVYYKKSTDGGVTWGSQIQVDVTLDDARAVWCDFGGSATRFLPIWQNDDLDDIYTNKDNSVVISTAEGNDDGTTLMTCNYPDGKIIINQQVDYPTESIQRIHYTIAGASVPVPWIINYGNATQNGSINIPTSLSPGTYTANLNNKFAYSAFWIDCGPES